MGSIATNPVDSVNNNMNAFIAKNLNIPAHELNNILKTTGAVITGSCILNVLDPSVPCNDVDIVVRFRNSSAINVFLNSVGKNDNNVTTDEDYRLEQNIRHISNFLVNGVKVQLMTVDVEPKDYIAQFDMDILQNYWDGQSVHITYPDAIASKQVTLTRGESCVAQARYRVEKYRQKGFSISEKEVEKLVSWSIETEKQYAYHHALARARKYYQARLEKLQDKQEVAV